MNSKDYLTNKAFCPIPWTGLMYNFDGSVKNCIRSKSQIGNINEQPIKTILKQDTEIKKQMREGSKFERCSPCYNLERNENSFDIISDRIFYLKELKNIDTGLYNTDEFDLHKIDIRWSNLCNFACIYCGPEFSSKWAAELNINVETPEKNNLIDFKNYIFQNTKQLKHVYLAGGEPLLMKENLELLELLLADNPDVNLRINSNLSKVDTKVFEAICKFKNVHWIVSVETIKKEYEYIRYSGVWDDFLENLKFIRSLNNHKITFNMLHFVLNYLSIFECIDFLKNEGYHNNSFVIGPITNPALLDVRNLPIDAINLIKDELESRINQKPGYMLENSYRILLKHITTPFKTNLQKTFELIATIDQRRNINSKETFPLLYQWIV